MMNLAEYRRTASRLADFLPWDVDADQIQRRGLMLVLS